MEKTAIVKLVVNGEEASSELSRLKSRVIELRTELEKAEQQGDNLSVKKLSHDLDIVERQILSLEETAKSVDGVLSGLSYQNNEKLYSRITTSDLASQLTKNRAAFADQLSGISIFELSSVFDALYKKFSSDSTTYPFEYKLPNDIVLSFKNATELRSILDDFIKSVSSLVNAFDWLRFNVDIWPNFLKRKKAPSTLSWLDFDPRTFPSGYPGRRYDINTDLEQEKTNHYISFASGEISKLDMQVADIESEIKANNRLLATGLISEKERHSLVLKNLNLEKRLSYLLDKELTKDKEKLDEEEFQRKRDDIYNRYQTELQELKSLFDQGLISQKSMTKKDLDYRIAMYTELLELYKKGSYAHYDVQRKLNDLLKKQMMENVKAVDAAVQTIVSRYFPKNSTSNPKTFSLVGTTYDLRTREEKESDYKTTVEAIEILRKRLIDSSNGDAGKIKKVNKYMDHAARWEEINYLRSIGEKPSLNWREQLEDFNNWFAKDETQQIIALASNVASQISGIFSNINEMIQIDLEVRLAKLNKYYDSEISMAEGNAYKVNQLEHKRQKDIAKARKEASQKELNFQVFQALAQTAQNALAAYGSGLQAPWPMSLWLAPMMAGLATAAGMVQLAVIYKQQQSVNSVGYQKGGFTRSGKEDEPVGVVHAGEWVASQKLVNSPQTRPYIDALENAQRTNTLPSLTPQIVEQRILVDKTDNETLAVLNALSIELTELKRSQNIHISVIHQLNERLNEPFVTVNTVTGETGIKQAQDEYLRLQNNTLPKIKRKKLSY